MALSAQKPTFLQALLAAMILVCLVLPPDPSLAGDQEESAGNVTEEEDESFMDHVDRYHTYLQDRVNEPAIWFDNFFGDPRADEDELPSSYVRVRVSARYTEGEKLEMPVRLRANIKLPKTSDKLRLVILGYDPDDQQTAEFGDTSDQVRRNEEEEEERSSVGLRYTLYKTIRSKLHFGGGTNNIIPFEYYFRASYRRLLHVGGDNVIRFREIGFWDSEDGFGETTRFDYEKTLPREVIGRVSLFGTHSEISQGVDWGLTFSFFKQLSSKTAASLDLGTYGISKPSIKTTNYVIACRTRANVLRPWLFLEIEPLVSFPTAITGESKAIGRLTVMMEIQFIAND